MKWLELDVPGPGERLKQTLRSALLNSVGLELRGVGRPKRSTAYDAAIANLTRRYDERDLLRLEFGVYHRRSGDFHLLHDSGLFSCLSTSLWSVMDLRRAGLAPQRLVFEDSLSKFKDEPGSDPYPLLFDGQPAAPRPEDRSPHPPGRFRRFDHHGRYDQLDFEVIQPLLDRHFSVSDSTRARADELRAKYLHPGARYVGVCIRGTDKALEVPPVDSSMYIQETDRLLRTGTVDRVLIQTDQEQVCQVFRACFPGVCDVFEDLPRTTGQAVIHKTAVVDGGRLVFAQSLMAAIGEISRMSCVLTHTGNIGAWICLMRGHVRGVWQAGHGGQLEPIGGR